MHLLSEPKVWFASRGWAIAFIAIWAGALEGEDDFADAEVELEAEPEAEEAVEEKAKAKIGRAHV